MTAGRQVLAAATDIFEALDLELHVQFGVLPDESSMGEYGLSRDRNTYAIFAEFVPPAFKLPDSSRSVISAAETGNP